MWSAIEDRSASPCLNAPSAVAPGLVCMRRLTFSSDGCGMLYPQNTTSALQRNTGREQLNSRSLLQKDMPWPLLRSLAEDSLAHDRVAEAVAEGVVLLGNHQCRRGIRGARDLQKVKGGNIHQYGFRAPRPYTRTACPCTVRKHGPLRSGDQQVHSPILTIATPGSFGLGALVIILQKKGVVVAYNRAVRCDGASARGFEWWQTKRKFQAAENQGLSAEGQKLCKNASRATRSFCVGDSCVKPSKTADVDALAVQNFNPSGQLECSDPLRLDASLGRLAIWPL